MKTTIAELSSLVEATFPDGAAETVITGVASVSEADTGDITFFGNPRYLQALRESKATAALVPLDFEEQIQAVTLKVENPSVAFANIVQRFAPPPVQFAPGIHPTAVIGENATLGSDVSIQPHAVIESGATIGDRSLVGAGSYVGHNAVLGADCRLHPNVTVRESCLLGDRVIIHSGTVVGSDGFGYEQVGGRHVKIPQVGIVQIDNDVEIGANVTIDRARFGRTWIQEGTKIDNLVQIAHNVIIGPHCILISQTGISGSTRLGHHVITAGQAGLVGHITIGDGAIIGAKSGVSKSVPAGEMWFGIPAAKGRTYKERLAYINRIGQLVDRVKKLEQQLAQPVRQQG
jgi:UDP-3-O-[3-hydroxymyristoyl] glucosamine N-acyltransferase